MESDEKRPFLHGADPVTEPLSVFDFPKSSGVRLWALPFCLKLQQLQILNSLLTPMFVK